MKSMSHRIRRVVQAVLYEFFAVLAPGPVLAYLFDESLQSTLLLSVLMSTIALAWNYLFNTIFEFWERRQQVKGRSLLRRTMHGVGFEGGLVFILVPVMAWWLDITLLEAFFADLGLLIFFFVYTVAFTWLFDKIFGLPLSAMK